MMTNSNNWWVVEEDFVPEELSNLLIQYVCDNCKFDSNEKLVRAIKLLSFEEYLDSTEIYKRLKKIDEKLVSKDSNIIRFLADNGHYSMSVSLNAAIILHDEIENYALKKGKNDTSDSYDEYWKLKKQQADINAQAQKAVQSLGIAAKGVKAGEWVNITNPFN